MPSLKNLWHKIRLRQLGDVASWRAVAGGLEMELDPTDFMDQQFFLGTYAPELDFIIQHWVHSGDMCIDIGAQKGFVTLSLASRVGNDGRSTSL